MGKVTSSACYTLISTTEVPWSKALNPDCFSAAAQWPTTHQRVAVLGLQV